MPSLTMLSTSQEARELHALAAAIAACLDGFELDPTNDPTNTVAFLVHADGPRLALRFDKTTERVNIWGTWPRDWAQSYSGSHVKIGVGTARGPVVIARDIARRLLPGYLVEFERARGLAAQAVDDAAKRHALTAEIAARMGTTARGENWPGEVSWSPLGQGYGDVKVSTSGDRAAFNVRGLTKAQALALADLLGSFRNAS
jgi:hypothetical protein